MSNALEAFRLSRERTASMEPSWGEVNGGSISPPVITPLAGTDNAFDKEDMDHFVDVRPSCQLALVPDSNELFSNRGCGL